MVTFNWELISAKSADNYPYTNEDGTVTLMNGVVTEAFLKLTATEGENEAVVPRHRILLDAPVPDVFAPLDDIEKATVLGWALEKMPSLVKEKLESFAANKLTTVDIVTTDIFND
jgi:hypothetical protein